MKRHIVLALALVVFSHLPVARSEAADGPKRGGVLMAGIGRDIRAMNPLVGTRSTEEHIRNLMFEPLLGIDLHGKIQPNLAVSWKVSRDGKVYTFQLREGVKFHNGKQMTAEDVKFSIDYTLNPKNGAYGYTDLAVVERVETVGRYKLRIVLKTRSVPFLASLTGIPTFSVVPKGSLPEGVSRPAQYPPGTGPFKFHQWQPKQRIVLRRHDDYWGQQPFVDQLVLRPVRNDTARITALQAGDLDMIERVPYEWVKRIQDGKLSGVSLVRSDGASYRRLVFNVAAPPFSNKRLRQAVVHALNKKEILQGAYFGFGQTVDQKYPRGHDWHVAGLPSLAYNMEKARALVKESGYDGQPIKILVEQSDTRESEELILQAQLKKIGLNIQPQVTDRGAQTALVLSGEFALVFRGGDFAPDPVATYAPHFSCEPDAKKRRTNFSGYCNKEVDSMFQQLTIESDPSKRKSLLKGVLTRLAEDVPELPIGFVPRFFALRSHVKGFSTDDNASFRWSGGGLNFTWLDK